MALVTTKPAAASTPPPLVVDAAARLRLMATQLEGEATELRDLADQLDPPAEGTPT